MDMNGYGWMAGDGKGRGPEGDQTQPIWRVATAHNLLRPRSEGVGVEQQKLQEER